MILSEPLLQAAVMHAPGVDEKIEVIYSCRTRSSFFRVGLHFA
jgi:hypothetical protein